MKSQKCIVPVKSGLFFEDKPKMISFIFIVQKFHVFSILYHRQQQMQRNKSHIEEFFCLTREIERDSL